MVNDDFLELMTYAVKAPSAHNTQPWKFKIYNNSVEIHPDFSRKTPVADPENRELYMSLGCAAENLAIAASQKRYRSTVSICESPDAKFFIKLELIKDEATEVNPLFYAISKRLTNRKNYNGAIISDDVLNHLTSLEEEGVGTYFFKNGETGFAQIESFVKQSNYVLYNDFAFKKELLQWIRFNKQHALKTRDGLTYNSLGFPPIPGFLGKPIAYSQLKPEVQVKDYRAKILSSSHLVLFTTVHNTATDWIHLGIYLERMLLKMCNLGISSTFINQPCELPEFVELMKSSLLINNQYPQIILRIGYGKKSVFSPRRPLSEVIEQKTTSAIAEMAFEKQ